MNPLPIYSETAQYVSLQGKSSNTSDNSHGGSTSTGQRCSGALVDSDGGSSRGGGGCVGSDGGSGVERGGRGGGLNLSI